MIVNEGTYFHALGLVYGEASRAEFPTADVTRDSSRAPFRRGRRPGRLHLARLDLLRPILVLVAAEI